MDVPAWAAAIASLLSFLGGLFGDLLKRVIPTYTDLVKEARDLRNEVRSRDEEIQGLEDTIDDDPDAKRRRKTP